MGTRNIAWTEAEIRQLRIWANNAEHDADNTRMLTRPGSPQEAAALADQEFIQGIQSKLASNPDDLFTSSVSVSGRTHT